MKKGIIFFVLIFGSLLILLFPVVQEKGYLPAFLLPDATEMLTPFLQDWNYKVASLRSNIEVVQSGGNFYLDYHSYLAGSDKSFKVYLLGDLRAAQDVWAQFLQDVEKADAVSLDLLPKGTVVYAGNKKYVAVEAEKGYLLVVSDDDGALYAASLALVIPGVPRSGIVSDHFSGESVRLSTLKSVLDESVSIQWQPTDAAYYAVHLGDEVTYSVNSYFHPDWRALASIKNTVLISVCGVDVYGNEGGCSSKSDVELSLELPTKYLADPVPGTYPRGTVIRLAPVLEGEKLYSRSESVSEEKGYSVSRRSYALMEDMEIHLYLVDAFGRLGPGMTLKYQVEE